MAFANATSGIHYYVDLGNKSNNCKIKGVQEMIKLGIFISFFNKNGSFSDILCH